MIQDGRETFKEAIFESSRAHPDFFFNDGGRFKLLKKNGSL